MNFGTSYIVGECSALSERVTEVALSNCNETKDLALGWVKAGCSTRDVPRIVCSERTSEDSPYIFL